MEACIVICRKKKSLDRKGKILFIDAKEKVTRKNAESYLEQSHINEIVKAYQSNDNIPGFASIVNNGEVKGNNNSLAISMYVTSSTSSVYNTDECMQNFISTIKPCHEDLDYLIKLINE